MQRIRSLAGRLRERRWFRRLGHALLGRQVRIWVEHEPALDGGGNHGPGRPTPPQRLLVATWWGIPVGQAYLLYVSGPLAEDTGWGLYSLSVHRLFRGLGIGERLVRDHMAWACQRGIPALRLYASERHAPSMALFRKLGFRRIHIPAIEDRLDREAGPAGRHLILMSKELEATG